MSNFSTTKKKKARTLNKVDDRLEGGKSNIHV